MVLEGDRSKEAVSGSIFLICSSILLVRVATGDTTSFVYLCTTYRKSIGIIRWDCWAPAAHLMLPQNDLIDHIGVQISLVEWTLRKNLVRYLDRNVQLALSSSPLQERKVQQILYLQRHWPLSWSGRISGQTNSWCRPISQSPSGEMLCPALEALLLWKRVPHMCCG